MSNLILWLHFLTEVGAAFAFYCFVQIFIAGEN